MTARNAAGTATTAPMPAWFAGDHIAIREGDFKGVYVVARAGVKLSLRNLTTGAKITAPDRAQYLHRATADEIGEAIDAAPVIELGAIGLYDNPKAKGHLYVVVKVHDSSTYNLARLGGDGNQYWVKVPAARFTPVDPAQIEAAYVKAGGKL